MKKKITWEHMTVIRYDPLTSGDLDFYCNGDQDTDTGGWEFVGAVTCGKKFLYYFKRVKP